MKFFKYVIVPIFSAIGLMHLTTVYMTETLSVLELLFRALVISLMLFMWMKGLDKLKEEGKEVRE